MKLYALRRWRHILLLVAVVGMKSGLFSIPSEEGSKIIIIRYGRDQETGHNALAMDTSDQAFKQQAGTRTPSQITSLVCPPMQQESKQISWGAPRASLLLALHNFPYPYPHHSSPISNVHPSCTYLSNVQCCCRGKRAKICIATMHIFVLC